MTDVAALLHLVDRAERGTLLTGEAELLRTGLYSLDAARRSNGGAQATARTLRARYAAAEQALVAAEARLERSEQRLTETEATVQRLGAYLANTQRACGAPDWPGLAAHVEGLLTRRADEERAA
ncbi:hypothetical protein HUT18_18410 [Streptomyces sp. NA04227]|uniref:hypothetical protein n=1 Tax=Streptomyces sp. NA04227 TaxID=2742136 RepID=UPI00158FFB21|nr:hypothetical protein [Streptomyces sp. NA04227]QKW08060.1 hypothetical protein HUT18_18410 [Streptomyces sp. NA04227]